MLKPNWYLYYSALVADKERYAFREFTTREELNEYLKELKGVTYIKVISGFTVTERGAEDNGEDD